MCSGALETANEAGGQRVAHQTVVVVLLVVVQPEFHERLVSGLKRAARGDESNTGEQQDPGTGSKEHKRNISDRAKGKLAITITLKISESKDANLARAIETLYRWVSKSKR